MKEAAQKEPRPNGTLAAPAAPTATLPSAAEPEKKAQTMDDEIRVMGQLVRILGKLPEPSRGRVVAWLSDRYAQSKVGE